MVLILVTPGQVVVIENVTRRGAVFESSILRFFSTMDLLFFFCFVFFTLSSRGLGFGICQFPPAGADSWFIARLLLVFCQPAKQG